MQICFEIVKNSVSHEYAQTFNFFIPQQHRWKSSYIFSPAQHCIQLVEPAFAEKQLPPDWIEVE